MAKPRNPVESEKITITTTPLVRMYLETLVAGGLYGKNAPEAAERLLAGAIEERIREGILTRVTPKFSNAGAKEEATHDPRRS